MIKNRRLWGIGAVLGGAALLGGCVAVPAGSYGYGYSDPSYYYSDPSPVVVQPNVYIDGTYQSRPRYGYPYYGGRPGYYSQPAYPRRGWDGVRPGVAVPVPVPPHGGGARSGGVAGTLVPVPPGRSRSEINRMMTPRDSNQGAP